MSFYKLITKIRELRTKKPTVWFFLYLALILTFATAATYWSDYLGVVTYGLLIIVLLIATLVTWLMAALACQGVTLTFVRYGRAIVGRAQMSPDESR